MNNNDWETEIYAKGRQINRWPFSDLVSDVSDSPQTSVAGRFRSWSLGPDFYQTSAHRCCGFW